jgi:hypothetical protein
MIRFDDLQAVHTATGTPKFERLLDDVSKLIPRDRSPVLPSKKNVVLGLAPNARLADKAA